MNQHESQILAQLMLALAWSFPEIDTPVVHNYCPETVWKFNEKVPKDPSRPVGSIWFSENPPDSQQHTILKVK